MKYKSCPRENKRAYVIIYLLEKNLRDLIVGKMQDKSRNSGSVGWVTYIPRDIIKKCEKRANEERKSYQSLGSEQLIDYGDFKDLGTICVENRDVFDKVFNDVDIIVLKLKELEMIRNTIAHNRSINRRELRRLELFYEDIKNCIKRR